jgi:uncharacterized membrane protein
MNKIKQLQETLKNLVSVTSNLKQVTDALAQDDSLQKIQQLENENKKLKTNEKSLKEQVTNLFDKNSELTQALQEQIIDEKLQIIKLSKQKIDILFMDSALQSGNMLTQTENRLIREIKGFFETIESGRNSELDELKEELKSFEYKLTEKIDSIRKREEKLLQKKMDTQSGIFNDLADQDLPQEVIKKRAAQNKLELKFGLDVLNKAGILLILLGIGAAAQYSYVNFFTPLVRSLFFFTIGFSLLAVAEVLFRKNKRRDIFSNGLTGGGIAVLYGAIFYSHFQLDVLGQYPALGMALLLAAVSVVLSLRYNSEPVGALSLVGGFLPVLTYLEIASSEQSSLLIVALYLMLLNASLVVISFYRSWNIIRYISFILHIPLMLFVTWETESIAFALVYTIAAFILYQASALSDALIRKVTGTKKDIALLAINSLVTTLSIFLLLNDFDIIEQYDTVTAILFSVLFALFWYALKLKTPQSKAHALLMFGTAVTFIILAVPFQFGIEWALFGWLTEGAVFTILGERNRSKEVLISGWILLGLSFVFFYIADFLPYLDSGEETGLMTFKFLTVIIINSSAAVYYNIPQFRSKSPIAIKRGEIFFYTALFTVWIFGTTTIPEYCEIIFETLLKRSPGYISEISRHYSLLLLSLYYLLTGYISTLITELDIKGKKFISIVFYSLGILLLTIQYLRPPLFINSSSTDLLEIFAVILLIVLTLTILLFMHKSLVALLKYSYGKAEFIPLSIAIYLLFITIATVTRQFDIPVQSYTLSFVLVLFALLSVLYGFWKRHRSLRLLGLGVVVLALAKLFIIDLSGLDLPYKILAYFSYGIILLGISYIYQRVKNSSINN